MAKFDFFVIDVMCSVRDRRLISRPVIWAKIGVLRNVPELGEGVMFGAKIETSLTLIGLLFFMTMSS